MNHEKRLRLAEVVHKNLKALLKATGMSQARLAELTGVATATVSNYTKPSDGKDRIPTVDFLIDVCNVEEFKKKGLDLTVDLLISDNFNPMAVIEKKNNRVCENIGSIGQGSFLGNYICYFSDATGVYSPTSRLRYGVISVYDTYESLMGDVSIIAKAIFFKEDERMEAIALKARLDSIGKADPNISVGKRNTAIEEALASCATAVYEGEVSFGDDHVFLNLANANYGDNALVILYSPQGRSDEEYIGGVASVNSVTRGRIHAPIMQKMIVSKYMLKCSDEIISEYLDMHAVNLSLGEESEQICQFARKLYSDEEFKDVIDEPDKVAMINRRLTQLVRNYIKDNIYSVEIVDDEEDQAVYNLIAKYKD